MTYIAGDPSNFDENPFTQFASAVSPIDEAKAFPLMFQNLANAMDDGFCRQLFADKSVQAAVISGSHERFIKTIHSGEVDWQSQLRRMMRDHLCYQSLGGVSCLSDFGPSLNAVPKADRWLDRMLEGLFPQRQTARIAALQESKRLEADKQVEQMVAKFVIIRASVVAAMFDQVINATGKTAVAA
jgi:hypothetical protein